MTIEQAINVMQNGIIWDDGYSQKEVDEAADISISALRRELERSKLTPCDVCRFNPPSSCDGKPCCMCPAECHPLTGAESGEDT